MLIKDWKTRRGPSVTSRLSGSTATLNFLYWSFLEFCFRKVLTKKKISSKTCVVLDDFRAMESHQLKLTSLPVLTLPYAKERLTLVTDASLDQMVYELCENILNNDEATRGLVPPTNERSARIRLRKTRSFYQFLCGNGSTTVPRARGTHSPHQAGLTRMHSKHIACLSETRATSCTGFATNFDVLYWAGVTNEADGTLLKERTVGEETVNFDYELPSRKV